MINPTQITNYNRTEAELEEFLMFAILVAGKGAEMQAKKLDAFLTFCLHKHRNKPFAHIKHLVNMGWLEIHMKQFKLGQYKRVGNAFKEILKFKGRLKTVTIEQLESISGIGSKTARFFILHSRPDANVAVLDTHILKWMNEQGYKNIPKATPPKKKYGEIEKLFLQEAIRHQMTPADFDLMIWKSFSQKVLVA
jgi:thermostable 8-oxoguanine DNA glycosylase